MVRWPDRAAIRATLQRELKEPLGEASCCLPQRVPWMRAYERSVAGCGRALGTPHDP